MVKVYIKGTIVSDDDKWIYDWFGIQATCPADIHQAVENAAGDELEVEINSGGGDVMAGSEIYTALRMYRGKVTCTIVGLAASAASYIATARRCRITPVGLYMIHNTSGAARGDFHAMDKESEVLQTVNRAIATAYMEKTSLGQQELLELMDQETWLTAEQAVEYGFVDSIVENQEDIQEDSRPVSLLDGKHPVTVYNSTQILGKDAIEKARQMLKGQPGEAGNTTSDGASPALQESVLINKKSEREEETMADTQETITSVQELADKYPELVDSIRKDAAVEAAAAENRRLKAIDEIAGQISEAMVDEAKYGEKKTTAQDLALEAFRRNGIMAQKTLADLKEDIAESGTGKVGADANAGITGGEEELHKAAKVQNLAEKLKRR